MPVLFSPMIEAALASRHWYLSAVSRASDLAHGVVHSFADWPNPSVAKGAVMVCNSLICIKIIRSLFATQT